jgi:DNA-binding transcriptional ArsR family regulator
LADQITIVEKPPLKQKGLTPFAWREFAISHNALLDKDLPPLQFLVDNLIATPGLSILAAKKKVGKSFMAVQLAQSVAAGSAFLGMRTKQGKVVHMALEDGERRLQGRLVRQRSERNLPIIWIYGFPPLNTSTGIAALEDLIDQERPALLTIDTLVKSITQKTDENESGPMGDLLNRIHDIALKKDLVILIIHHHGKVSSGDPGFDMRGSSAIPGATDTNMGLYKQGDGTFVFKAEGRDIGEIDIKVEFDKELTWAWQCVGDAKDLRRIEAENRITETILMLGEGADASAIAQELGMTREAVQVNLKRMREEGIISFRYEGKRILYRIIE